MFDSLSDVQKQIVFDKSGKFVVRACPGSGKTYTVAARLAHQLLQWDKKYQGIATLSFTNVAWQEIQKQISKHFSIPAPLPFPHFLGTIDSFVNRYIFLPHGHRIMGCTCRPILVGEPYGAWKAGKFEHDYDKYFGITSFDINDNLIPTADSLQFHFSWKANKDGSINGHVANVLEVKEKYFKKGYANQADANYFAMKVLQKFPSIAKALVHRFPILVIDEAQDTSDIQMTIIDSLIASGLNEIVLVGDPDQSIFEWNEAKPQLLLSKFEEWRDNSIILNENRRSSQPICNSTCKLSSLESASLAVSEVKDFACKPQIISYNATNLKNTIDWFLNLCREHGIDVSPDNVAVLCRSKGLCYEIAGVKEVPFKNLPWCSDDKHTEDFAKGKYLYDNGDFVKGFKLIEKAIYKGINKESFCSKDNIDGMIDAIGFSEFRKLVFDILNLLPSTDKSIEAWVNEANCLFTENEINITLSINKANGHIHCSDIFGIHKKITETPYRLGTVHSVKGETFEAVLLMLKQKGIGKYYKSLLDQNADVLGNEELRIVYVGITRPRKILVIAVPDEENKKAWERKLL